MAVPEGRHKPRAKRPSEMDLRLRRATACLPVSTPHSALRTRHSLNTGCKCIGFQMGRDSMFSASRASRTWSGVEPNSAGSIRITVSQRLQRP
jgi:hypothetical protein